MLTTYVETLEAAFGSEITASPRHVGDGSAGKTLNLLNWLWTVPAASSSVVAVAAVVAARLAGAARAACDADADMLLGRLRRCVPVGRAFNMTPSTAVIISELREHSSRIGVPLPADYGLPAPTFGGLCGDDAATRCMLLSAATSLLRRATMAAGISAQVIIC